MTDETLVIRSKIKDMAAELSVSKDFADALDVYVKKVIERAIERAKENGRSTIMPRDI